MSVLPLVLFCAVFLLCNSYPAKAATVFQPTDIVFNEHNTPYQIYNYVLPTLMGFAAFGKNDHVNDQAEKAIRYVNFFSLPDVYMDHTQYHLYTDTYGWWSDVSLWFKTSNIKGMQQGYIARDMLTPYLRDFAIRDIAGYSYFEMNIMDFYSILDPMNDSRYRTADGRLATFDDIRVFLEGQEDVFEMGKPTDAKTLKYFSMFKKENIEKNPEKRHEYLQHIKINPEAFPTFDQYLDVESCDDMMLLSSVNKGCDPASKACPDYFLYIRNKIYEALSKSKNIGADLDNFQNYFLNSFLQELGPKGLDAIYAARNVLLLGRCDLALKWCSQIPNKDELVYFTEAQAYYLKRDVKAFNALTEHLIKNDFYRYMYWQLNGSFLRKNDKKYFESFPYRSFALDVEKLGDPYSLEIETR